MVYTRENFILRPQEGNLHFGVFIFQVGFVSVVWILRLHNKKKRTIDDDDDDDTTRPRSGGEGRARGAAPACFTSPAKQEWVAAVYGRPGRFEGK
jgi:hypothetical protein